MPHVILPRQAWHRLARMQRIVAQQPDVAWAVSYMPLHDQLELTLELLDCDSDNYLDEEPNEPRRLNVIRFRVRRPR